MSQFIRVTGHSNEIPILNSESSVGHLTQVNEGNQYHLSTGFAFVAVLEYTTFLYCLPKCFAPLPTLKEYKYDDK